MRPRLRLTAALSISVFIAASAWSPAARGATFAIINADAPGEGLNDPTVVVPAGGNSGTTLGQQRLIAVERAAAIWGALLHSTQTIRLELRFDALFCATNSVRLGIAGPTSLFVDFAGAPSMGILYPSALADSLVDRDLAPDRTDIEATFNSAVDSGCFQGAPQGFYYGLDGSPPMGTQEFLPTALHELAHGLGFGGTTNMQTGAKLAGFDDAYTVHVEDHTTGMRFPQMSDSGRLQAMIRSGELHWVGPAVRAASGILSEGRTGDHVHLYAPAMIQDGSTLSHFDTTLVPDELMEPFFLPMSQRTLTEALLRDIGWRFAGEVPTPTPTGTPTPLPTFTGPPTATGVVPPSPTNTAPVSATPTRTPTATATARPTTAPGDPGDGNCDARFGAADLVAIVTAIGAGGTPACPGADTDGSGTVDATDLELAIPRLFDFP